MMYTLLGPLPRHLYVYVEPNALGEHPWLSAVWFALVSYPGRAWGCNVLLECGAVYRNVPLHQLATKTRDVPSWAPAQAASWDCYGMGFTTIEYPYLAGLTAHTRLRDKTEHDGQYLFTAAPIGDGFSAVPEQAKEFFFLALDNGRLTAQPTNHVLLEERSFTEPNLQWPQFLKRQTTVWSAEDD